jgi:hypothetical protein
MLNHWLEIEDKSDELSKKYDYWILGENVEKEELRWCVITNVLHWLPAPGNAQSTKISKSCIVHYHC